MTSKTSLHLCVCVGVGPGNGQETVSLVCSHSDRVESLNSTGVDFLETNYKDTLHTVNCRKRDPDVNTCSSRRDLFPDEMDVLNLLSLDFLL